MTAKELLDLCWMSYLDLPPLYASLLTRGGRVPVAAFADSALRMDAAGELQCVSLNEPAREAARRMRNSAAVIEGYINNNDGNGFAAYVVKAGDETVIAMRGSERTGDCVSSNVDWIDNVCEPFSGSVQLESIRRLIQRYAGGKIIYTGHSKGGHNALNALAISDDPLAKAVVFNAQGFAAGTPDENGRSRLRERGVNYVVDDDVVGALLEHPERRIYVRQRPGTNAHMPDAYMFNEDGSPVRGRRTLRSYAVEAASRAADRGIAGGVRKGVREICISALNEYD